MKDAIRGLAVKAALYGVFVAVVMQAPESESFAKGFITAWILFDFGGACVRVFDRYARERRPVVEVSVPPLGPCLWHESDGTVPAWICRTVRHNKVVGRIRTIDGVRLDCTIHNMPDEGWTMVLPSDPVEAAELLRRSMRLVEVYIPEGE